MFSKRHQYSKIKKFLSEVSQEWLGNIANEDFGLHNYERTIKKILKNVFDTPNLIN